MNGSHSIPNLFITLSIASHIALLASYITHLKKRKHLVVWLLESTNG
jgi:hypothetical protein